eukprot:6032771-Prymnesium_polylepis.1
MACHPYLGAPTCRHNASSLSACSAASGTTTMRAMGPMKASHRWTGPTPRSGGPWTRQRRVPAATR